MQVLTSNCFTIVKQFYYLTNNQMSDIKAISLTPNGIPFGAENGILIGAKSLGKV